MEHAYQLGIYSVRTQHSGAQEIRSRQLKMASHRMAIPITEQLWKRYSSAYDLKTQDGRPNALELCIGMTIC
jgi:hypothetical protein